MTAPAVSVVICTYNRLRMLEAAITSCLRDATRRGAAYEIVIADNSPSGHAEALVQRLNASGGTVPVRWAPASPPNISIARNAGIRAAAAPLVAFLDDDLEVEPGWLDHFMDVMASTGAHVAVGPVRPRFAAGAPPAWDPAGSRFTRVLALPTGSRVFAGTGNAVKFAISTASSIWRRDRCFTDPAPFDPAFGASGGEDLDLFLRLERRGCRFVWCAEAGVWETVPDGRVALGYSVLRAYSGAQVYAAATIRNAAAPRRRGLDIMARGVLQTVGSGVALAPFAALKALGGDASRYNKALFGASSGLGKLLWWRKVPLYHVEKPPV